MTSGVASILATRVCLHLTHKVWVNIIVREARETALKEDALELACFLASSKGMNE